jgi:hypothetical protein
MGMALRLLSRIGTGRMHQRHAGTLDQARADFETAWRLFSANGTKTDFDAWRDQRDWTERKYAMWERGEKLPSQTPTSMMSCPGGERFDSHDPGRQLHSSMREAPPDEIQGPAAVRRRARMEDSFH